MAWDGYIGLKRTTDPTAEPITVADVMDELGIDTDAAIIGRRITAAREAAEEYMGRSLITQVWTMTRDLWPGAAIDWWDAWHATCDVEDDYFIEMPYSPLVSVDSVTTYDADDTATAVTVNDYFYVDTNAVPGRMVLRIGAVWPIDDRRGNQAVIVYTTGYGATAASIPARIRQGMIQHVAWMYENRGDSSVKDNGLVASGARAAYRSFRVRTDEL